MPDSRIPQLEALRFSAQNEKFSSTVLTGFISAIKFDKLGNMDITIKVTWDQKESLLPNLTFATAMPLHITMEPYDGRS